MSTGRPISVLGHAKVSHNQNERSFTMKSPAVPDSLFGPWADARWTRIPSPEPPNFEVARWAASIDGCECVLVAYGNEKNRNLRVTVQGVNVRDVARLTQALYAAYFAEKGRGGAVAQRQTRLPLGAPGPAARAPRPAVGHYREGGGRR
jgi:hypothetical protein